MKIITRLKLRAKKALQIFKGRYLGTKENIFLEEHAAASILHDVQEDKNKTLFDFLQDTYMDIAQSDPEIALDMLKNELSEDLEPQVEQALIEIEAHIRSKYCHQYFAGMRVDRKAE